MISRLSGAVMRAGLVVALIAMPPVWLPGGPGDAAPIVVLLAIFGAGLTLFEYASGYPVLLEFRDAPPFNRLRFICLGVIVFLLTLLERNAALPTPATQLAAAIGGLIATTLDFPYSPVRLLLLMLPQDVAGDHLEMVRAGAGLALLVALLTVVAFALVVRLSGWPTRRGAFNVWVNLPTFDPTTGGDVVARLERDARLHLAVGFLLPFLTPGVVKAGSSVFGAVSLDSPQAFVWIVAAWAFLPASFAMRGIALGRVAELIADKRRRLAHAEPQELLVV